MAKILSLFKRNEEIFCYQFYKENHPEINDNLPLETDKEEKYQFCHLCQSQIKQQ